MSTPAHVLVDQVLQRVRSPEGITAPRAFILRILSAAQNLVNAKLNYVLDTVTLVTEPERVFYPVRTLLPQATKPLFIREDGRDLVPVPWRTMYYMKRGWPRQLGERHQLWSLITREIVVVWPAKRVSTSLTVVSTRRTLALTGEQDLLELQDEALPIVVDLAVVLTLLRMRNLAPIAEAAESLVTRMKSASAEIPQ